MSAEIAKSAESAKMAENAKSTKAAKATRQSFGEAIVRLAEKNPNIVVMDADLGKSTMTSAFMAKFPDRYFEMGIAEQNLIGTAAGLASAGKIQFATSFACFIIGRYETIRMSVSYANTNVKLVGTHAGVGIGEDGNSQMGLEDMALLRSLPNFVLLQPSDDIEAQQAVEWAAQHNGPVYLRLTRQKLPNVHRESYKFQMGAGDILQSAAGAAGAGSMAMGQTALSASTGAASGMTMGAATGTAGAVAGDAGLAASVASVAAADAGQAALSASTGAGSVASAGSVSNARVRSLAVFATGGVVANALVAGQALQAEGIPTTVVNLHTIKPIDAKLILELAKTHSKFVTVEDHYVTGGLGSAVSEVLTDAGISVPLLRHGVYNFGESGTPEGLYDKFNLSAPKLQKILQSFFQS